MMSFHCVQSIRPRSKCSATIMVVCDGEAGHSPGGLAKNQASGQVILAEAKACTDDPPEVAFNMKSI